MRVEPENWIEKASDAATHTREAYATRGPSMTSCTFERVDAGDPVRRHLGPDEAWYGSDKDGRPRWRPPDRWRSDGHRCWPVPFLSRPATWEYGGQNRRRAWFGTLSPAILNLRICQRTRAISVNKNFTNLYYGGPTASTSPVNPFSTDSVKFSVSTGKNRILKIFTYAMWPSNDQPRHHFLLPLLWTVAGMRAPVEYGLQGEIDFDNERVRRL